MCACVHSYRPYVEAPRLLKDFAHDPEKTDLDELGRVDAKPGAGWKSARGATPGTRKPRAGYYQIARHEAVAAGVEAGSDEDDDATELPPWNAILRTGEEEEEEEEEEERRRTKCRVFFFPTFPQN